MIEWLVHYFAHGVDRVSVYQNEADGYIEAFLRTFIHQIKVTTVNSAKDSCEAPFDRVQSTSFINGLRTPRFKYDWDGIFDVDELFVASSEPREKLVHFLDQHEFANASSIRMPTIKHCFGSDVFV
ncbi:hypothetical protein FVE85_0980 [Porphyridium purpureum]|uniref:Glycosyltransferase family 92 protein n=1 Tax=Porphyridium purpureum TaxID=35688 RepID=A0A5J4Z045_PORPP|nr:hypothetical protein FVE85_0980 [Porphyridium purpureum]|eukprot:POR6267..scf208_2